MATQRSFMGFGMNPFLAGILANTPVLTSVSGATAGAAIQLTAQNRLNIITASNGGSGCKVPPIGGDGGIHLGDEFQVFNAFAAAILVYADNNAAGSSVVFWNAGASTAGTTGISVSTAVGVIMYPISASVWLVYKELGSA